MWYPYGLLYDDNKKQGPMGENGLGFKLTNDGNYDIEMRSLRYVKDPILDSEATTKTYVDVKIDKVDENIITAINDFGIQNSIILKKLENEHNKDKKDNDAEISNIKSSVSSLADETSKKIQTLDEKSLKLGNGSYNAENHIIGNLKDPKEPKNAVNKRYLEKNSLVLDDKGAFDAKGKVISNLSNPTISSDAANRYYVDNRTYVMTTLSKDLNNALFRLNDGLFVQKSLEFKNNMYNLNNQKLTGLIEPINDSDAVTKSYADNLVKIDETKPNNIISKSENGFYVSNNLFPLIIRGYLLLFSRVDDLPVGESFIIGLENLNYKNHEKNLEKREFILEYAGIIKLIYYETEFKYDITEFGSSIEITLNDEREEVVRRYKGTSHSTKEVNIPFKSGDVLKIDTYLQNPMDNYEPKYDPDLHGDVYPEGNPEQKSFHKVLIFANYEI